MSGLFQKPFLTCRFDLRGGGIDFLGMRQVNLAMLQDELLPGINNATADLGTFCLGAWIPWKFRQLSGRADFVLSRYTSFREAMEVAIAYATRDHSPAEQAFGRPRTRMGIENDPRLPGPLSFKAARNRRSGTPRTNATSLYSAPLYGPALRYLGFLQPTDAVAADGTSTKIPLASEDEWTQAIVRQVESSLAASAHFPAVVQLRVPSVSGEAIDDLGQHGLHPSFFRKVPPAIRRPFLRRFFSADLPGERRRLTAGLICKTVTQQRVRDYDQLRHIWYTNLLDSGDSLVLDETELRDHRLRWAVFGSRQIQRTILEVFLRCFELAVGTGCRTVDQVVLYWKDRSRQVERMLAGTVGDLVQAEARPVHRGTDLLQASRAWNATVSGAHQSFDDIPWSDDDGELGRGLRMLARWWLRMLAWVRDEILPVLLEAGQPERLSMGSFHRWVEQRLQSPLIDFLRSLFSDLVFAQHVRVALMRFDGEVQRLRFTLGDDGIISTPEVGDKLGEHQVRMADRLYAFVGILCDAGILEWRDDGQLTAGPQRLPSGREGAAA